MARICFADEIKHVHGRLTGKSGVVFKHYNPSNINYSAAMPEYVDNPTADDIARRTRFATAATQTKTVMADPTSLEPYRAAFKKQNKYCTLRGYVFAKIYEQLA